MKILLADSDRDLLQSYEKLLTMDGEAVTTAFDGAQVTALLARERFDVVVLEEKLPRIGHERLMLTLQREDLPVIVLLDERVGVKHLLRTRLPCAYLPFPFLPDDLTGLIEDVLRKRACGERLVCGDLSVDTARFRFSGTDVRLTAREISLLARLAAEESVGGRRERTVIHALNEKLRRLGRREQIEYELKKGYRLVSKHE